MGIIQGGMGIIHGGMGIIEVENISIRGGKFIYRKNWSEYERYSMINVNYKGRKQNKLYWTKGKSWEKKKICKITMVD